MLVLNCSVMSRIVNKVKEKLYLVEQYLNQCVEHMLLNNNNNMYREFLH